MGLANFGKLVNLKQFSSTFVKIISWNVLWTIMATSLTYFGGLGLALLYNKKCVKAKAFFRAFPVVAYALPGFIFVAILICRLLYQHTGNPYLGGIFCGVLATVSEWGICEIRVHTPGTQYAGTALVYALIAIGFVVTIACAVLLKKNNAAVQAHK